MANYMNDKIISLDNMLVDLCNVSDESWGYYAFSRDILNHKINDQQKDIMIANAIKCGEEYADKIIEKIGSSDPNVIANELGLTVDLISRSMIGQRILFAQFTTPNQIEIIQEPIEKAKTLFSQINCIDFLDKISIINIILAHEIFHYIEEQYKNEIYTRTEKILLWNFLGIKNHSTIRAIGEIAGMSFAKKINQLNFSPFILDFLLYYGYQPIGAKNIYNDVLAMTKRKETYEISY